MNRTLGQRAGVRVANLRAWVALTNDTLADQFQGTHHSIWQVSRRHVTNYGDVLSPKRQMEHNLLELFHHCLLNCGG